MTEPLLPPATIGIVGGGQLGRMLAQAAKTSGYMVGILDPTPNAPAAQVADWQLTREFADTAALIAFAKRCDLLTYEFENVDLQALEAASQFAALPQGTELLRLTRDRRVEKAFLTRHGLPTAPHATVADAAALPAAIAKVGYPAILKTATGGYDGHGQVDINQPEDLPAATELAANGPCLLEGRLTFIRELAVMVTRTASGIVRVFPVVENRHRDHILHLTLAPAPHLTAALTEQVTHIATTIATALHLRGVLGVELFETPQGLYVNELAPRPHNSGHYSIEACNFSQFEAHIRSIVGLPIPPIRLTTPAVMRNLLGAELAAAQAQWSTHPEWHLHDYGKAEARPGRKMGHLTVTATDATDPLAAVLLKGESL